MSCGLPEVPVEQLKLHPAMAGLLPPLGYEERAAMKQDIAKNGVLNPLHVPKEGSGLLIMDECNRWELCLELLE